MTQRLPLSSYFCALFVISTLFTNLPVLSAAIDKLDEFEQIQKPNHAVKALEDQPSPPVHIEKGPLTLNRANTKPSDTLPSLREINHDASNMTRNVLNSNTSNNNGNEINGEFDNRESKGSVNSQSNHESEYQNLPVEETNIKSEDTKKLPSLSDVPTAFNSSQKEAPHLPDVGASFSEQKQLAEAKDSPPTGLTKGDAVIKSFDPSVKEFEKPNRKIVNSIPVNEFGRLEDETRHQVAEPPHHEKPFVDNWHQPRNRPLGGSVSNEVRANFPVEYALIILCIFVLLVILFWRRFWYVVCSKLTRHSVDKDGIASHYKPAYKPL